MRFVHISDPHLLSLSGARLADYASKRWIGRMNLLVSRGRHHRPEVFDALVDDINREAVDHVVVTGDVTNIALPCEFEFARGRFDRLAGGPPGVTVVPGNHDAYVQQGAELFSHHFEPYHLPDADWLWPDGAPDSLGERSGARWPVVRVRGDLAIIGLSTSLQTPWFTAYGVLGDVQLERLRAALGDSRLAGKFRVIAIHHPPAGPPSSSRIRGLRDRARLAEILAESGAELVLHGHEHRDLVAELSGPRGAIPVRGIPSASYEAHDHNRIARYRIYELERSAGSERPVVAREIVRIWDPANQRVDSLQKANDSDNLTADQRIG